MTTTGLETIDHSVHFTNEWLKDLSAELADALSASGHCLDTCRTT
jgi:hypothetical protein